VLANFTQSTAAIIVIMSVAFFSKGLAGLTWTLVGDMAPKELLGVTGGIFNTIGNIAGIVTIIVIGIILSKTQSFVASILLVGALSYIFIVNNPRRIELPEESLPKTKQAV